MSYYRHLFHAGSFSDVFKHALLSRLLIALGAKGKPYFYLDTHAGIGLYDLTHEWASKTREFEHGIGRLWERTDIPAALVPYMEAVRARNTDGKLRFYPGSPLVALALRRPDDRLLLTELNKDDCATLDAVMGRKKHVAVSHLDGYQALNAALPPKERRGLVLHDSSFDRAGEFRRVARALRDAHELWPTGMYAVWYPMMENEAIRAFARDVENTGIRKVLRLELLVRQGPGITMPGCGMLVVNPPWKFDTEARPILEWLARTLSVEGAGRWKVDWLMPE